MKKLLLIISIFALSNIQIKADCTNDCKVQTENCKNSCNKNTTCLAKCGLNAIPCNANCAKQALAEQMKLAEQANKFKNPTYYDCMDFGNKNCRSGRCALVEGTAEHYKCLRECFADVTKVPSDCKKYPGFIS